MSSQLVVCRSEMRAMFPAKEEAHSGQNPSYLCPNGGVPFPEPRKALKQHYSIAEQHVIKIDPVSCVGNLSVLPKQCSSTSPHIVVDLSSEISHGAAMSMVSDS